MDILGLDISQLGSIAAILQLFVTGYLSYRVYELTQRLLELEEHEQKPGKIRATAVDKEKLENNRLSFTFRVKNIGEGRTEVERVGMPLADMGDHNFIAANGTSTPEDYTTPLVLDPEESYEIKAQFRDIEEKEIQAVGLEIYTENNPQGFRQMTDSGAGNF